MFDKCHYSLNSLRFCYELKDYRRFYAKTRNKNFLNAHYTTRQLTFTKLFYNQGVFISFKCTNIMLLSAMNNNSAPRETEVKLRYDLKFNWARTANPFLSLTTNFNNLLTSHSTIFLINRIRTVQLNILQESIIKLSYGL